MQLKNTKEALQKFARYVVTQSRSNLTRQKKVNTKKLYSSIKFEIEEFGRELMLIRLGEDYLDYVDKGVSGTERKYPTPFTYKQKKPPLKNILQWVKAKNFRLRDEKGRFTKGNYRSIAFVLQNSIYKKGFKPSLFFTRPFQLGLQRFREDIAEAFMKDIDNRLDIDKNLPESK